MLLLCARPLRRATPPASGGVGSPGPRLPAGQATLSNLLSAFADLADSIPATIGLAAAPIGSPKQVVSLGAWKSGAAWSTSKVPLVVAVDVVLVGEFENVDGPDVFGKGFVVLVAAASVGLFFGDAFAKVLNDVFVFGNVLGGKEVLVVDG